MNRILQIFVALSVTVAPLGACTSKGEVERVEPAAGEPRTGAGQAAKGFVQARDQFIEQMGMKLAEIDARITVLKNEFAARTDEQKAEARSAHAAAIARLEARRAAAREVLEQAKNAGEDRWDQIKSRTDETVKSIEEAYEEAARELRK